MKPLWASVSTPEDDNRKKKKSKVFEFLYNINEKHNES